MPPAPIGLGARPLVVELGLGRVLMFPLTLLELFQLDPRSPGHVEGTPDGHQRGEEDHAVANHES